MDLHEQVERIQSRQDFVAFALTLSKIAQEKPDWWCNADLDTYLEALSAWAEDMDGYHRNSGEPVNQQPSWQMFGRILLAASTYE